MLDEAGKVAWKPSLPKSERCQETLWKAPPESKLNPESLTMMDPRSLDQRSPPESKLTPKSLKSMGPRSLDQRSPVVLEESQSTALRRACLAVEAW